jgi:hypothetical protein
MESGSATVERFHPTSSRVWGLLVQAAGVFLVAVALADPRRAVPWWVVGLYLLAMVVGWAAMLRPALWVAGSSLVMRGMVGTVTVPLAGIEELRVRQVLALSAGGRRWTSPVIGRTRRRMVLDDHRLRGGKGAGASGSSKGTVNYADWVTDRLGELTSQARREAGVRPGSPEQAAIGAQTTRRLDVLPLGLMGAAVLLVVLAALFG